MASLLYRLGRWAFRHRRLAVAFWALLLIGLIALGQAVKKPESDAFNVPGTESDQALELLEEKFPGTGGASARIVFAAPEGEKLTVPKYQAVVQPTVDAAGKVPQTVTTPEQFLQGAKISPDETVAYADLQFEVPVEELKDSTKDALEKVAQPAEEAGLQVEFSGGVIATAEESSIAEVIGLVAAFIVLMISFGSLRVAGMPLLTALIGVGIGLSCITALTAVVEINSTAPTLALMLGLAVGIDYALFIVSRHRQQLNEGMGPEESAARAVATAGSAVVFAGLTVVIALVALLVIDIPFLSVMGLAAAGTVTIAVLIALTMLPALLGFAGQRAAGGRKPPEGMTHGERWCRMVTRRPVVAIVGVIVILGAIAIPALDMVLGLPDDGTKPEETTERKSFDLLSEAFGPGYTGPLTTVIDTSGSDESPQGIYKLASDTLSDAPNVAEVSPPIVNQTGDVAIIIVTPKTSPSSQETKDLVAEMRKGADEVQEQTGVVALVTGNTAINIDTSDKLESKLPSYLIVIVGLALILLTLVFRSVAVPVKAVIGFLLTIGAALGVVVWIFQEGHFPASLLGVDSESPVVSFLPILLIGILFGLAMDYEVFLVSRKREAYVRTKDPLGAVIGGFSASARVVTAAALIMMAVFAGFILSDDVVTKSIGFALAFGVMADAFLVRMTLVPAVLALLGHRAWWLPDTIDRAMPNLDIEGENLKTD